jgi:hypothetical protein
VREEVQSTLEFLENCETDAGMKSYLEQILPALEAMIDELELLVGGEWLGVKELTALVKDGTLNKTVEKSKSYYSLA